jgi:hypothetical protein
MRILALLLGIAITTASATTLMAFSIDPRCAQMDDKVGCTCALTVGHGGILGSAGARTRMRWFHRNRSADAFMKCKQQAGRQ